MATFEAVLMHGNRGGEGTYRFDGDDDLMARAPDRVMRAFMEWVQANAGVGAIDYELNAAMKDDRSGTVTALGKLIFDDGTQPFVCMITRAEAALA
jgi:hypothetical protein